MEPSEQKIYPTPWQRKILWTTITSLSVAVLCVLLIGLIYYVSRTISFLQPLLIPFAIAGVLFYLLEPIVAKLVSWRVPRFWGVLSVFAAITLGVALTFAWVLPSLNEQARAFGKRLPEYQKRAETWAQKALDLYERNLRGPVPTPAPAELPPAEVVPQSSTTEQTSVSATEPPPSETSGSNEPTAEAQPSRGLVDIDRDGLDLKDVRAWAKAQIPALGKQIPTILSQAWNLISQSLGGFLGAFGFIVNLVIVPVYLFFLLLEGPTISRKWSDYLPLKSSELKTELVSLLTEINGYLIAFFRGQVVVSMIDGLVTGIALVCLGLEFGFLIGILLAILGMIPYLGIVICWIPAALIAAAQWGDWQHVLWVTLIFVAVQQLDGIFIAPKIVGESVGLHPLTVIMSVFAWSLLLGGLLGAILAVPLTATLKVIFKRYVWDKKRTPQERALQAQAPPRRGNRGGRSHKAV